MNLKLRVPVNLQYSTTEGIIFGQVYGLAPSICTTYLDDKDDKEIVKVLVNNGFERCIRYLSHYTKIVDNKKSEKKEISQYEMYSHKKKPILIYNTGKTVIYHTVDDCELVDKVVEQLHNLPAVKKLPPEEARERINLLCFGSGDFFMKELVFKESEDIVHQYPKNFMKVHESIMRGLSDNRQGIVLLHGAPGTGKTSYIKHLSSKVDRKFLLIPPNLINRISSPEFLTWMIDRKDMVLIVEDAEHVIASRDKNPHSVVGELLNLSDGLIGQSINCAVICTFNTSLTNIDKALLRKGRLIAEHKFDLLNEEEANNLFKQLGKTDYKITGPMSIADIYNYDTTLHKTEVVRSMIGFNVK